MSWTEFVIYRDIASTEGAKMSTLETLLKTQNWGKKVSYSKVFAVEILIFLIRKIFLWDEIFYSD